MKFIESVLLTKLVTFGCSYTQGTFTDPNKPWPSILSQLLSLDLDNQGDGGSSNKQIWYTACNYQNFTESDIVVFNWTHIGRHTIITNPVDHDKAEYDKIECSNRKQIRKNPTLRPWLMKKHSKQERTKRNISNHLVKQANAYYNLLYDEYDTIVDMSMMMNHIDLMIKNTFKCPQVYHFVTYPDHIADKEVFNRVQVPSIYILEFREKYGKVSKDDNHPNEQAHFHYAHSIYEHITGDKAHETS